MKESDIYEKSILLIGPSGAGKSTVAKVLAKKMGMQRLCLDKIANKLHQDQDQMRQFPTTDQFQLFLLEKGIESANAPGICDFGAGHSIFRERQMFEAAQRILLPFKNIVFLLPSPDPIESLKILNARTTSELGKIENSEFLKSPCNKELATMTIYTNGKTPEQISDEILNVIKKQNELSTKQR